MTHPNDLVEVKSLKQSHTPEPDPLASTLSTSKKFLFPPNINNNPQQTSLSKNEFTLKLNKQIAAFNMLK
jgi:hypothetical protein